MTGRWDLAAVGRYRFQDDPMEIVSGPIGRRHVHFMAPASAVVPQEMRCFLEWWEQSSSSGRNPLPAITRAGLAHLWFESIHPFEDGNGRLGRAIVEKALAQGARKPIVTGISSAILRKRTAYYQALDIACRSLDVNAWLQWFAL